MDFIDDIVAHAAPAHVVSPLRPAKDMKSKGKMTTTKEEKAPPKESRVLADYDEAQRKGLVATWEGPPPGDIWWTIDQKIVDMCKIKSCEYCERTPCIVDELSESLVKKISDMDNREIRRMMYREISIELWGRLGKGVRKQLPKCVVDQVHAAFPTKRGERYKSVEIMSDSEDLDY
jgi:hypothetical protein